MARTLPVATHTASGHSPTPLFQAPYHFPTQRMTDVWYALMRQTLQTQTNTLSLFIADDRWIPRTAATHRPLWKEWAIRVHYEADTFFPDGALPGGRR